MISLLFAEVLILGTIAFFVAYFYSEISWQNTSSKKIDRMKQSFRARDEKDGTDH